MSATWRHRLQLVAGLLLVVLAAYLLLGTGEGERSGEPTAGPPTSTSTPGPSTTGTASQTSAGAGTTSPSTSGSPSPRAEQTPRSGLSTVAESALPPEGRTTLGLIRRGGPYPYQRDGVTFFNRERLLPQRPRGYYREYTVPTPGERDRGARRIVGGRDGDRYYTDDHYASFRQIEEDT